MIFLAIQNTYTDIEIALFDGKICIDILQEEKQYASKNFVILLDCILKKNNIKLVHLVFCAVNQGPSPFTTLRTVIASVNGLHFALGIPLIGIDGLDALVDEYKSDTYKNTLILLNAFNNDIYFCLQQENKPLYKGYKKITYLLDEVHTQIPNEPIQFLGNGTILYKNSIESIFEAPHIYMPEPMAHTCSIEQIGKMGYNFWEKKEHISSNIVPLYLKQHTVYNETSKLRNTRSI